MYVYLYICTYVQLYIYLSVHVYSGSITTLALSRIIPATMLNLTFELLKLFAEGGLPATTVQRLAAAAWQDGWGHEDAHAERLKGVGTDGKYPGNCLRDLLVVANDLGIGDDTPAPYYVEVKTVGGASRQVGVFLPHEQLDLVVRQHGVDSLRLSAQDWQSEHGLGPLMRSWGDSPDVQVDCSDRAPC